MKDSPLIISLLVGLIVVLVIVGVSLLVRMNTLDETYKKELAKSISLQKNIEELKSENIRLGEENSSFKEEVRSLNLRISDLAAETDKLRALKDRLEENLKEELMEKKLRGK